jgi:hypothetical protein
MTLTAAHGERTLPLFARDEIARLGQRGPGECVPSGPRDLRVLTLR